MKLTVIDTPAYTLSDAEHHLRISRATLRSWVLGREYPSDDPHGRRWSPPLIEPAEREGPGLSFRNMIELYVLGALRREYEVELPRVREAVRWLRNETGSNHPLADLDLMTDRRGIFVHFGDLLLEASHRGQTAMPEVVGPYLERVERDASGPRRLFPLSRPSVVESPRLIVMDPRVRFGRPFLADCAVETHVIFGRFNAGDSVSELADEFGTQPEAIEEALRFERGRVRRVRDAA